MNDKTITTEDTVKLLPPEQIEGLGHRRLQCGEDILKLDVNGYGLRIDATRGANYISANRDGILRAIKLLEAALDYYPEEAPDE